MLMSAKQMAHSMPNSARFRSSSWKSASSNLSTEGTEPNESWVDPRRQPTSRRSFAFSSLSVQFGTACVQTLEVVLQVFHDLRTRVASLNSIWHGPCFQRNAIFKTKKKLSPVTFRQRVRGERPSFRGAVVGGPCCSPAAGAASLCTGGGPASLGHALNQDVAPEMHTRDNQFVLARRRPRKHGQLRPPSCTV